MGLLVSKSTLAALVTKYALSGMHIHIPAGPIDNDSRATRPRESDHLDPYFSSLLARRPASLLP